MVRYRKRAWVRIMNINNLQPAAGGRTKQKRLGRGIASGHGKTCCKGHKGQWARSGGGVRVGFEGGQVPLHRRLPKVGFDNAWKKEYTIVNLSQLEGFDNGAVVTAEILLEAGIISKVLPYGIKVLGSGTIDKKLTVEAAKFSKSAKEAIEKTGGTAKEIVKTKVESK